MINWLQFDANQPLLFTRPSFWIFFVVVFAVFCLIHKKLKWRSVWLLFASLFFYYKSSGFYFILLILSVLANYGFGRAIAANRTAGKRWLAVAVVFNLAWLVYYKYVYLFAGWFTQLTGVSVSVHDWLGDSLQAIVSGHPQVSDIVLPVGISFFTFQAISYVTDIYRRKIEPLTSIFDFGFYLTFFPQLVAGPIVRAADFVPQISRPFFIYREEFGQGLFFIINGLVKKIIVADYISVNFVDRVFDSPTLYSGFENLLGVYGYAIQIYCDFSGYTDIAIGIALWLGFRLSVNFNSPYKADCPTDFWRRWHISLSSWLRDYLYIPLGGNRKGRVRTYVNLFLVMLIGGLWHGANLKFVIWGALHGLYLVVDKLFKSIFGTNSRLRPLKIFLTFNVVAFTWIVFRADSLATAHDILNQIFTAFNANHIGEYLAAYWQIIAVMVAAYVIHWLPNGLKNWYRGQFAIMPMWLQLAVTVVAVFVLVQFSQSGLQPFIYFQF